MRYAYIVPQKVTLLVGVPKKIDLCANDTQRFQVAFALNQSATNVEVVIRDTGGNVVYDQTWTSGFTISANMVRWGSITFTESSYAYDFTMFTKEINLDDTWTDDSRARASESVMISPLKVA